MKLNTLLLTSAATLMATSVAFAADLPSKKAAPAGGAVQVCKVGSATGFKLPGSDSCVVLGGFVRLDHAYRGSFDGDFPSTDADALIASSHKVSLKAAAYTATEMGDLAAKMDLRGSSAGISVDSASISLGGFKAGWYDSAFGLLDGGNYLYGAATPSTKYNTIGYTAALGGATLGIAWENSTDAADEVGDVVGTLDMSAAGADIHFGAASHMHDAIDGYAFDVGATFKPAAGTSLSVEYAYINEDAARIADTAGGLLGVTLVDADTSAQIVGAELSHAVSASATAYAHGTWAAIETAGGDWDQYVIGLGVDFQPVKKLHIQPEIAYVDVSGAASGTGTLAKLRIQRDF